MKWLPYFIIRIPFLFVLCKTAIGQAPLVSKNELLKTGAHYYPDRFPKNQWSRDFEKMAGEGFQFVHFGPFYWNAIEPEEGKFKLDWLEEAVGLASKNGLKVVLATPSARPPLWVLEKYPETFAFGSDGLPKSPFESHPCSWSSSKFKELVLSVNKVLVQKFGNDSRVIGWQIDHEPNQYASDPDYGQMAQNQFAEWLKEKYKEIENLNSAWNMEKSGLAFSRFSQIRIPNQREAIGNQMPSGFQDFRLFISEVCSGFIRAQAEEIRKNSGKTQWITSDFQPWLLFGDTYLNSGLDFVSINYSSLSGFASGFGQEGFRINDGFSLRLPLEFYKSPNSSFTMTNLSPGQIQSGRTNPQPFPGSIRLRMFQAAAASGKWICINPFRQDSEGQNSFVEGVVGPDGVSLSPGGTEIGKTIKELREIQKFYKPEISSSERRIGYKTAILVKKENFWDMNQSKLSPQWNSTLHLAKYYEALQGLQVPVNFLGEDVDFEGYKFLVVPGYSIVSKKLAERLNRFVEKGGHLILTCRFAQKDESGKSWKGNSSNPLKSVAGISHRIQDMLPEGRSAKVSFNSKNYEWNNWAEILQTDEGTETLARFEDQFYKNATAVSRKTMGKGSVTYIGVETDAFRFEKEILKEVYQKNSGRQILELPDGVEVQFNGGLWFGFNFHSTETRAITIPAGAKVLLGSPELKPSEVVVWTEK